MERRRAGFACFVSLALGPVWIEVASPDALRAQEPPAAASAEIAPREEPDQEARRQTVEDFLDLYVRAWNAHSARALASLWDEGADYADPYGAMIVGRRLIEEHFERAFGTHLRLASWAPARTRIRQISENMVLVDWQVTVRNVIHSRKKVDSDRDLLLLLERKGDEWWIVAARSKEPAAPPVQKRGRR